ncbi:MAG: ribose-phosphate diphosphokinase [Oscillospiraceae bacterium]|nr:ribose-phosphate diphosphokinase [Oscillospiraceae bacterium]
MNEYDNSGKGSTCELLTMRGIETFSGRVRYYLEDWHIVSTSDSIMIDCPRFSSGEAKGIVLNSIRGKDVFILSDPFNYSITYKMRGQINNMSPDDHFQDLKRILSAIGGKAKRISVIMPMLYCGRQHRKQSRESLDCANALIELEMMGVSNIITFDAHDARVQNAIPFRGFDDISPRYQMLKAFISDYGKEFIAENKMVIISPDEGAFERSNNYSSALGADVGMFYKQRNQKVIVCGKNPIVSQTYIGGNVCGKNVIVVDDMLSSGASLLNVFQLLKEMNAVTICAFVTFGLFCEGASLFDEAYEKGLFDKIYITNLTYTPENIKDKPWLRLVDMSKYVAYIIKAIHNNSSVGRMIAPDSKIHNLMKQVELL